MIEQVNNYHWNMKFSIIVQITRAVANLPYIKHDPYNNMNNNEYYIKILISI